MSTVKELKWCLCPFEKWCLWPCAILELCAIVLAFFKNMLICYSCMVLILIGYFVPFCDFWFFSITCLSLDNIGVFWAWSVEVNMLFCVNVFVTLCPYFRVSGLLSWFDGLFFMWASFEGFFKSLICNVSLCPIFLFGSSLCI